MSAELQRPFDVAVVMTTVVRPTIRQAVRSVFEQRLAGRVQLLIGIDRCEGDRALIEQLQRECPGHVAITLIDLGYSTSARHGGLYPSRFGGSLKTVLSYAANSRHVTYLDDDNWYAPDHLARLLAAVQGNDWAFSLRHFVDGKTGDLLCPDLWESTGPGAGVFAAIQGGFVDTNCYLIDKMACHEVFTEWAMTRHAAGTGGDRQIFARLKDRPWGASGTPSLFYRTQLPGRSTYSLWRFRQAGVALDRYLPASELPGAQIWAACAAFDARFESLDEALMQWGVQVARRASGEVGP
jgi:hypothetical protein